MFTGICKQRENDSGHLTDIIKHEDRSSSQILIHHYHRGQVYQFVKFHYLHRERGTKHTMFVKPTNNYLFTRANAFVIFLLSINQQSQKYQTTFND